MQILLWRAAVFISYKCFSRRKYVNACSKPLSSHCREIIFLKDVPDQVFAGGMMGEGIAFTPETDTVTAPCDGTIIMIAETLHAIGIQAENGAELLIHVGMDTVNLNGNGFTKLAEANQKVKQGDPILKIDLNFMKEHNINLTTPMIVTNSEDYTVSAFVDSQDGIVMTCSPKANVSKQPGGKKGKYDTLAEQITDLVGGKDNVTAFTHCVTRLRLTVKNKDLVNTSAIEDIENVVGCNWAGNQLQIIIGQSIGDAYKKICEVTDLGSGAEETVQEKQKFSLASILDYITGSIAPVLPALIGCGMLKVLILVLEMCGVLTSGVGTDQMLTFAADAAFYFLPVLVARGAAKKLNTNETIAMVIGGFAGGCIAGIFHVYVRAFYGSAGIFAIPSFISDDIMTLVWFIISLIVGMIITFILTCILYKDEK